jgi:uncharacterized protein (DUF736 family)
MAFEQKDNTGALFKNKNKNSDNHPDYQGSVMVGGKEYQISAWLKKSKGGTPYMSLSFGPPYRRHAGDDDTAPRRGPQKQDDDIPF